MLSGWFWIKRRGTVFTGYFGSTNLQRRHKQTGIKIPQISQQWHSLLWKVSKWVVFIQLKSLYICVIFLLIVCEQLLFTGKTSSVI